MRLIDPERLARVRAHLLATTALVSAATSATACDSNRGQSAPNTPEERHINVPPERRPTAAPSNMPSNAPSNAPSNEPAGAAPGARRISPPENG